MIDECKWQLFYLSLDVGVVKPTTNKSVDIINRVVCSRVIIAASSPTSIPLYVKDTQEEVVLFP